MKKQLIAALISTTLLTSSMSHASEQQETPNNDHQPLIGLGSGLVLGAVVAGPVGAIIGAFTGGIIGKSVADESELETQQAKLAQKEQQIAMLNEQKHDLQRVSEQYAAAREELEILKQRQGGQIEELALGLNVQFKTGSSTIEPHFQAQLDEIADVMAMQPELTLDLTGYADRRGESSYNQALSEQRVAEVRSYLVKQGIESSRLQAKAFGATAPVKPESSFENDFFDRRVTLKLMPVDTAVAVNKPVR
ncbi:sortase-associated OmpA-like protein PdsO [Shewanella sp. Isolate11]|uniref:sortase-associated OmpA-like protein PdsO n=1 Tax=Shewanella sp. Isolate11 TaxID=2908530 RepID=UPI001EFE9064|nr:sortase-associated OmpA-like protein PdsO [Shewanella sp. Isolate11]MCG9696486.1 sortase-associated OmpA-like protein PdsO [Shewanella sp. Isolate11]